MNISLIVLFVIVIVAFCMYGWLYLVYLCIVLVGVWFFCSFGLVGFCWYCVVDLPWVFCWFYLDVSYCGCFRIGLFAVLAFAICFGLACFISGYCCLVGLVVWMTGLFCLIVGLGSNVCLLVWFGF